jgi:hypothetical protein
MSNQRTKPWAWRFRLAALLWLPGFATAQTAADIVSFPGPPSAYFPVAPGGSGEFAFEIRDVGGTGVTGSVGGTLEVPGPVFEQYRFTSLDAASCALPVVQPFLSAPVVRFAFAPVPPGGTRTCRYRVDRAAGGVGDLGFNTCLLRSEFTFPYCWRVARIGSLPDLELALDTIGAGNAAGTLVRLRLVNRSTMDVESRVASTGCHEFGFGSFGPTAFDIDSAFPGGCPRADGALCLNFTGQLFDSRAFRLGPVPAGGSASCLVRVVPWPGGGADRVPLALYTDRVQLPGGVLAFDPRRERESVEIGLGLAGALPVPVGPTAAVILGWVLMLAGAVHLRRRMPRARSA